MVFLVMTCTISYGHLILNGTAAIEGQRENHRQGRYLVFPRGSNLRVIFILFFFYFKFFTHFYPLKSYLQASYFHYLFQNGKI